MFRVPVALLLLVLVIPRLPAIPTGPALLHRVPRAAPGTQSDLEGDTDVLVQDVDQVINKVNKALGDTDDSAGTDSDDAAKGLSVKTTEVRISPTQDQKTDEGEEAIPGNPDEGTTNGEEEKPDEKSAQGISEDALLGAVIQDALENPELLNYFLSKAGDAEGVLLAVKEEESVPPAFLFPQKAPVADNSPEVEIVEEPPKPVADSINLDDEKTEEVLEELEADHAAQESADLDEEEEDYDDEEDLDEEEEMEGADEDAELDASVLGLLGPQKSVAFSDEDIEDDDDDDDDEDLLGAEDDDDDDDEIDDAIDDDSEDDDDEYVDSDDVMDDGELPDDVEDDLE
ncbi:PREDICTED: uncharacterized protein LOC109475127 [Branchiostoma belcheri]|uniref:Uncharacterized protein LOC109475127 n=1 Tax=Branchiostoma belcheri TaxID=7741 RepID=A0A6P4Z3S6_BRABE|nr:PREDICTED: uncharacterized protein LOC109475127 [Branchiostoma belcheri]